MTALTALAVAGETRRVPLMTCETVETETPASRATSAIVVTPPPGPPPSRLGGGNRLSLRREASTSKRLRNRFDAVRGVESGEIGGGPSPPPFFAPPRARAP